ncbi:hypothetical protein VTI74DRAFT_2690 [Chaetomium olivicolor]
MDVVGEAHKTVFRWTFGDSLRGENYETLDETSNTRNWVPRLEWVDERARKKVDSVVEWLSSGSEVYHIAGRLGSGKSTMRRYPCGHRRSQEADNEKNIGKEEEDANASEVKRLQRPDSVSAAAQIQTEMSTSNGHLSKSPLRMEARFRRLLKIQISEVVRE